MICVVLYAQSNHSHNNTQCQGFREARPIYQRFELEINSKTENDGSLDEPLPSCKWVGNRCLDSEFEILVIL